MEIVTTEVAVTDPEADHGVAPGEVVGEADLPACPTAIIRGVVDVPMHLTRAAGVVDITEVIAEVAEVKLVVSCKIF